MNKFIVQLFPTISINYSSNDLIITLEYFFDVSFMLQNSNTLFRKSRRYFKNQEWKAYNTAYKNLKRTP